MSVGIESLAKHTGEAGHSGQEIRSDVRVQIGPREYGGIDIELESRVKPYYGDSIRRQTEEVLEALGVRHARVAISDEGALPFVIAARIEAAARRAGLRRMHARAPGEAAASCAFCRAIACGDRGFTFPAASPSISSMLRCTERMP